MTDRLRDAIMSDSDTDPRDAVAAEAADVGQQVVDAAEGD